MDRAGPHRQHGVPAHAVKTELNPAVLPIRRLELTADAVPPRVIHAQHRRVRRHAEPRPPPGLLDGLPLELELALVARVLPDAAAALTEVGTARLDPVSRRFQNLCGARVCEAATLSAELGLDE